MITNQIAFFKFLHSIVSNHYYCELIYGNKSNNSRRGCFSGGISFYYKCHLKKYVNVIEKHQQGIIWVKLYGDLFPFQQDVYLGHVYIIYLQFQRNRITYYQEMLFI